MTIGFLRRLKDEIINSNDNIKGLIRNSLISKSLSLYVFPLYKTKVGKKNGKKKEKRNKKERLYLYFRKMIHHPIL